MTTPNFELMRRYGNEEVFAQKTAGEFSLLQRLGLGLFNAGLAEHQQKEDQKHRQQAEAMNMALRELELERVAPAVRALRYTPVQPYAGPSGADYGFGRLDTPTISRAEELEAEMDGSTRLASIAAHTGAELAKQAGIGGQALTALGQMAQKASGALGGLFKAAPAAAGAVAKAPAAGKLSLGLGLKGQLALGGMAAGGLYLGNKAIQATTRAMSTEAQGPPTYGPGAHGYQLPFGVNSYGQPQLGTPL